MGVGWNPVKSNTEDEKRFVLSLMAESGAYSLLTETVDEETCNPLKVWHDLGEVANLTEGQKKLLQQASQPLVQTRRLKCVGTTVEITLLLKRNAVVYFEVEKCDLQSDRGYNYERTFLG